MTPVDAGRPPDPDVAPSASGPAGRAGPPEVAGEVALVRVRLDLAYDGTDFVGWAAQPGLRSVQGVLEQALATVLRVGPVRLTVAGRTDSGVHARGQVAHLDVPAEAWAAVPGRSSSEPGPALVRRLAGVLPADVVVRRALPAPEGFDARFAALCRRYVYRVSDAIESHDPLRRDVLRHRGPLDVEAMDRAAARLTGEHDFAAYCKAKIGGTTVRDLHRMTWSRPDEGRDAGLVVAEVVADAFCHSMVRSLVGACLAVGLGRRPEQWPAEVLAATTRDPAVTVVPAHGLTLEEVRYPRPDGLRARALQTRSLRGRPRGPGDGDGSGDG